jgi:hypothetical protein
MEKNDNGRLIITVLVITSAIFLASTAALYVLRQSEIDKRVVAEKKLEDLTLEKAKLTKELGEMTVIKSELEVKLSGAEEKTKSLEDQLGTEKKSSEAIYGQLENEKKESRKLVDDLMKAKEEKEQITLSLADAKSQCEVLKVQLYSIQQAKEILENKLKEMMTKSEVELEKIVVKPEAAPAPEAAPEDAPASPSPAMNAPGELRGEILVVNKKFDFAVISLGADSGIQPGMNVGVYRNGKFLTVLQVEKVHPNMSAAKIPSEAKNIDLKEGDEVIVK